MGRLPTSLLAALLYSLATPLAAGEKEVLFNGDITHSGYCEMDTRYTSFNNQQSKLEGFTCAWLMNDRFYIGGSAHGSPWIISGLNSIYYQGGLLVGYYFQPEKLIHYNIELFTGYGGLLTLSPLSYTVVEPSLGINLNITRFAKLRAGASYRFVSGVDSSTGYGAAEINGTSIYLGLLIDPFEIKYPFREMWERM